MSDHSFSTLRTPNKSTIDFSVNSTCSSVKKTLFQGNNDRNASYTTSTSTYGGGEFMMQAKIEHLEKERIELTMQLHKRDEKDRDRKLKLEQMEFRLKASEEERQKAVLEAAENREQSVRIKFEADELRMEITRLNNEIQNTNRVEAMDVWKKMTTASRALKKAEDDLVIANSTRDTLLQQVADLTAQLEESQQLNCDLEHDVADSSNQIKSLLQENERISQLETEIETMKESFEIERAQTQKKIAEIQQDFEETMKQKEMQQEELKLALQEAKNSATIVSNEDSCDDVIQLRKQLFESESKRRKLHNQLQDLKGNIRVFLRCRPFLTSDGEEVYQTKQTNLLLHEDKTSVTVLNPATLGVPGAKPTHQFAFDHIFTPETKQQEVYKEVSDLVQSVLDGYRVCVFSYGQTGSGKTHTMSGNRHGDERGIIPRSVEELLRNAHTMQSQGWEIEMTVSIVEIYNEDIRDLLAKPTPANNNYNNKPGADKGEKIKIGRQNNRVVVSGLTTVPIYVGASESSQNSYDDSCAMQQFYEVFNQSMESRSTASTGMNELSSRSHLIVMIDVAATLTTVTQGTSTMTLTGGLRLCDLAGSERLDRTNTLHDATRLRETVNINKSLSCLADVFLALQNKAPHIPYRNSKLTMLLQDCLSGDGKALMFVNVSPTIASSPETLCSLRFAAQVNSVELGKAQKNVQTTTVITQAAPAAPSVSNHYSTTTSSAAAPTNGSAAAATSAAPVTRSRRMSVMPAASAVTSQNTARHALPPAPAPAPVAVAAQPAPQQFYQPPPPPATTTLQYQPSSTAMLASEIMVTDDSCSENMNSSNNMMMTATKEHKSVRFGPFLDEQNENASANTSFITSNAPLSSMKPFANNNSFLTTAAPAPAPTAAAALSATSASRSRNLGTVARRAPTAMMPANANGLVQMPTTTTTTTSNASVLASSLLSAAKAAKSNADASLLFSSNVTSTTGFVINAASLSSSTSSASATTTAVNKENLDLPQHNTFHTTVPTSSLLSGAKRDASCAALNTEHHHYLTQPSLHNTSNVHHSNNNSSASNNVSSLASTLCMPPKRLRTAPSAAVTTDAWNSSLLNQPAQRKSTWR